jgi:BirA family transcriptional regulator, biotin operon repressor / biotin---[acetyl-CoA-carboxylase] ligase
LFTGHAVKAPLEPLAEACRGASLGHLGAGDVVWSRNAARASCALVLEPEVPFARACQMLALGCVAAAETLGALCPAQVAVEFRWPGVLLVNGGAVGAVRLAGPPTTADAVPDWLALGFDVALAASDQIGEPGLRRHETALAEEGAGDITRTALLEALAPRLLAWLYTWQEAGFRQIHDQWLVRIEGRAADTTIDGLVGRILGLDEEGRLLFKPTAGSVQTMPYLPHLQIYS